jgi:hypothetical protein
MFFFQIQSPKPGRFTFVLGGNRKVIISENTVKYQFEMPWALYVYGKIYFGLLLYKKKQGMKKKLTSHIVLLSHQPTSTANPALMGRMGCAIQKDNVGCHFFFFPYFLL